MSICAVPSNCAIVNFAVSEASISPIIEPVIVCLSKSPAKSGLKMFISIDLLLEIYLNATYVAAESTLVRGTLYVNK